MAIFRGNGLPLAVVDAAGGEFPNVEWIDTETGEVQLEYPVPGSYGQTRLFVITPVTILPEASRLRPPYRMRQPLEWKPKKAGEDGRVLA